MGNATSKAARKLPATPKTKPSWAGARTGEVPSSLPNASHSLPRTDATYASENRDKTIEADAQDPHMNPDFMRNLGRIGQVKVDHHMSSFRAQTTRTQNMFNARANAELQASSRSHATQNRVAGPTLAALLTRRHAVSPGSSEFKLEAQRSGMDSEVLERVARFVNAPAVRPGSEQRRVGDDGVEHVEMTAMWKSPQV